jgi:glutamine synthetase adenylyltransferase
MLAAYFATEAEPWEALSWLKARCLSGTEELQELCREAVDRLCRRFAGEEELLPRLAAMRQRVAGAARGDNLKLSPGGSYDLDYLCGALALRHGLLQRPGTPLQRIEALREIGALPAAEAELLQDTATLLRSVEHAIRLNEGRARKWLPANPQAMASIEQIVARMMGRTELQGTLEAVLRDSMRSLRAVFLDRFGIVP